MVATSYQAPVSELLTYGDCREMDNKVEDPERDRLVKEILAAGPDNISRAKLAEIKPIPKFERWPNYVEELGLTSEHVPALVQMATDDELNFLNSDDVAVWAPIHAWRSLGQLKAEAAVEPLMPYFKERDADWAIEEIPWVLGMIGEEAIAPVAKYLATRKNKVWARVSASETLERIAVQNPELKETCVEQLSAQLKEYARNPLELNAFLVSSLIELEATDQSELIEAAYQAQRVDETVCGTWPSVQVDLGLAKEEDFAPDELRIAPPDFGLGPRKPTASDLGLPTKAPENDLSVVYGKGTLPFGKAKGGKKKKNQKKKGFGAVSPKQDL